jgi:hypothetical protein
MFSSAFLLSWRRSFQPFEKPNLSARSANQPLTVGDIAALKLDYPQLAYLSACHAASSIAYRLLDEAIHMAGACQLAGFPSVANHDKYQAGMPY